MPDAAQAGRAVPNLLIRNSWPGVPSAAGARCGPSLRSAPGAPSAGGVVAVAPSASVAACCAPRAQQAATLAEGATATTPPAEGAPGAERKDGPQRAPAADGTPGQEFRIKRFGTARPACAASGIQAGVQQTKLQQAGSARW